MHGHRSLHMRVDAKRPRFYRSGCNGIEVYNLCQGMHAGIGAARTLYGNGLLRNGAQGLLQFSLHRMTVRLPLPSTERLPVVLYCQRNSH